MGNAYNSGGIAPETTAANKARFLDILKGTLSITSAARIAGLDKSTIYRWRGVDEEFARAMDTAQAVAGDVLEESAYQRALAGDVTLTIFMLKGAKPERYHDRHQVQQQTAMTIKVEYDEGHPPLQAGDDGLPTLDTSATDLPLLTSSTEE